MSINFNGLNSAQLSPQFGAKRKGTGKGGSKGPANNPPQVTRNHLKKYRLGQTEIFNGSTWKLAEDKTAPLGRSWVSPYSNKGRKTSGLRFSAIA